MINVVSDDLLDALADNAPAAKTEAKPSPGKKQAGKVHTNGQPHHANGTAYIESFLKRHLLKHRGVEDYQSNRGPAKRWVLDVCPWDSNHTGGCAYIILFADGSRAAGCHHDSCAKHNWRTLHEKFEPKAESSEEEEEPLAEPVSLSSLWKSDPDLREVVIDGILRRGQVGNLISTSKAYKTYLIIAMAICMVRKAQWLDRFQMCGGRVLIIDLELQRGDITYRTHGIIKAMHADSAFVGSNIDILSLRGKRATVDQIERMLLAMTPRTYSLVIIDPLYKTYPAGFDENSNAQMTDLYRRWERLAEYLDAGLFIVHHGTKGSQSEKRVVDVGAGASAQSRSADAHIAIREHEVADCVVLDARLRSFAPIDPMVLRWNYPVWERDIALSPDDLKTGRKSRNKDEAQPQPVPEPSVVWTPAMFVETFVTDKPVAKDTIIAKANLAEMSARKASDLLRLAAHDRLVHRWAFPKDRTVYFATIEQPVVATVEVPK